MRTNDLQVSLLTAVTVLSSLFLSGVFSVGLHAETMIANSAKPLPGVLLLLDDSDSGMLLTGGGIIRGVDLEDPAEISFNAFIHIYSECYDKQGIACVNGIEPVGNVNIDFHNTNNANFYNIDNGEFWSNYFAYLNVKEDVDPFGDAYTAVIIIAYGQFNGEDDWSIEATFRDYGEPGSVKASAESPDKVYIRLRDPNYDPPNVPAVYATAWGDFGDGHFTDLDEGNLKFYKLD